MIFSKIMGLSVLFLLKKKNLFYNTTNFEVKLFSLKGRHMRLRMDTKFDLIWI